MRKYLAIGFTMMLFWSLLTGCGSGDGGGDTETKIPQNSSSVSDPIDTSQEASKEDLEKQESSDRDTTVPAADFTGTDEEMFTDRDRRSSYEESSAVKIQLSGDSAAATSDSVKIAGSTIQITEEATYILSGTLTDGMLVVNASDTDKIQLVLNGVEITSSSSAALYVLEADKVVLTLAEGTENILTNGGSFIPIDDNNIDAALYSKQDLTINGSGTLHVTSPVGHGIVSKDDLVIVGGQIRVEAASHGLDANDSVRFTEASLAVAAGKDGIHCENNEDNSRGFVYISGGTMDIQAEGDGISAGYYMHITDGDITVLAGGGSENGTKESSDGWGGFFGGGQGGRPGGGQGGRPEGGRDYGSGGDRGGWPGGSDSESPENGFSGFPGGTNGDDASDSLTTGADGSTSMKGLKSAGDMLITGGSFTIDSADDALHSNTSMTIQGGTYQIASGDDAFHAEDTLTVSSGTIRITESYEGLEALHVAVLGGDIDLVADDDGINAAGGTDASGTTGGRDGMFGGGRGGMMSGNSNGSVTISGGTVHINASGDGIDANGTLEITGGDTIVMGPTQGDTATLDYDKTGTITGGTFIGTGSSMMAQTFSDSEQGVISVSVGTQAAGTPITLTDKDGNRLLSYTPELSYQIVILSTPDLVSGETYTITVGEQSGEFEAG